ncbi:hypothetical protein [Dongia sp.]|uniref:hypothetical protein n=1 Tax=Dongia sp. TaxID=1977262 RepID=UPI0037528E26
MTRAAGIGIAALLAGGAAASIAAAQEQRIWLQGYSDSDEIGAGARPFIPEGAAEDFLPPGFAALPGRKLHILSQPGERDTATAGEIAEGETCGPTVGFSKPLNVKRDQRILVSTAPISIAEAKEIPSADPKLAKGVAAYLSDKGLKKPKVAILRALQADLDGDGKPETIVEAMTKGRDLSGFFLGEKPGDFSFVAVGALSDAGFKVAAHAGYIIGLDQEHFIAAQYEIQALPDFTGSGRFDLAVYESGYEWGGVQVFAWSDGSLKTLASSYCGA